MKKLTKKEIFTFLLNENHLELAVLANQLEIPLEIILYFSEITRLGSPTFIAFNTWINRTSWHEYRNYHVFVKYWNGLVRKKKKTNETQNESSASKI